MIGVYTQHIWFFIITIKISSGIKNIADLNVAQIKQFVFDTEICTVFPLKIF